MEPLHPNFLTRPFFVLKQVQQASRRQKDVAYSEEVTARSVKDNRLMGLVFLHGTKRAYWERFCLSLHGRQSVLCEGCYSLIRQDM